MTFGDLQKLTGRGSRAWPNLSLCGNARAPELSYSSVDKFLGRCLAFQVN